MQSKRITNGIFIGILTLICAVLIGSYLFSYQKKTRAGQALIDICNKGVDMHYTDQSTVDSIFFKNGNITDNDLPTFIPAFNGFASLNFHNPIVIKLNGSNVSDDAIKLFQESVPFCKFINQGSKVNSHKIDLQNKTKTLPGTVETYWFENSNINLKNTLFHRITIPLKEFNSGFDYEEQPVETEIRIEWLDLKLKDPELLDGLDLNHSNYPEAEASIYIGSAHNRCLIKKLLFTKTKEKKYSVTGNLMIEFENELVSKNESFIFETEVEFIND